MILEALKARNEVAVSFPQDRLAISNFAPSALDGLFGTLPEALPQAIAFRAFGAPKTIVRGMLSQVINIQTRTLHADARNLASRIALAENFLRSYPSKFP